MRIDLNCDLGESFGAYRLGEDERMMTLITSANIACGAHAGDPVVMAKTVGLALRFGVRVGAHPGWPDLQGFGRRSMDLAPEEAEAYVLYQVGALAAFARAEGGELTHVKPHGALYNQAAKDRALAAAVARAVARFSRGLVLVGLAGSRLIEMGVEAGLCTAAEGFPDRTYDPDGLLRPRRQPGAVLHDPDEVASNAVRLACEGIRITTGSEERSLPVDTLCLHGDNPAAVENACRIRAALETAGVKVEGF